MLLIHEALDAGKYPPKTTLLSREENSTLLNDKEWEKRQVSRCRSFLVRVYVYVDLLVLENRPKIAGFAR